MQPYRSLNTLPNEEQGLPYGTLISQEVHQWQNEEFRVSGFAQNYAAKAYFHQDHLGSTVKISGDDPTNTFRWDYTPMGEAYGFKHRYSNEQMTRTHVDHSPKRHLVPYLYTGKYETNLTGMVQMDARWYQPKLGRWLQPDYYNFAQLSLPNGARQQLLASTGLNIQGLLRDPAQQMRYGYVSGNFYRWADPLGLATYFIGGAGDKGDLHAQRGRPTHNIRETRDLAAMGRYGEELKEMASDAEYVGYEEYESIVESIQNLPKDEVVNLVGHSRGGAAAIRLTQDERLADKNFGTVVALEPVKETIGTIHYYQVGDNVDVAINIHSKQTPLDVVADVPIAGTVSAGLVSGMGAMVSDSIDGSDVIATAGGQLGQVKGMINLSTDASHRFSGDMLQEAADALANTSCP